MYKSIATFTEDNHRVQDHFLLYLQRITTTKMRTNLSQTMMKRKRKRKRKMMKKNSF